MRRQREKKGNKRKTNEKEATNERAGDKIVLWNEL
jgi:hypothetical protein